MKYVHLVEQFFQFIHSEYSPSVFIDIIFIMALKGLTSVKARDVKSFCISMLGVHGAGGSKYVDAISIILDAMDVVYAAVALIEYNVCYICSDA